MEQLVLILPRIDEVLVPAVTELPRAGRHHS